jgi:hypothetical protein
MITSHAEEVASRLQLTEAERRFCLQQGLRSWDSLYAVLEASPGLDEDPGGIRRAALLEALRPLLSDSYRITRRSRVRAQPGGAAMPEARAAGRREAAPLAAEGRLHGLPRLDLLGHRLPAWPVRDQGRTPACIAFAAAACIEWLLAERDGTFPPDPVTARRQPPAHRTRSVTRLAPDFLYARMRALPMPDPPRDWDKGATKFEHALAVLERDGLVREETWRHLSRPDGPPELAQAEGVTARPGTLLDLPPDAPRPSGVARLVHDLLAGDPAAGRPGRPVAIALPQFRDPKGGAGAPSNWQLGDVLAFGVVQNPPPYWERAVGHAVCVLGFEPDAEEPMGGWFIFRNSLGLLWAGRAPEGFRGDPRALVPGPGYGAISASHVEQHCWEVFSPELA